jgi:hypothetical protein
MNPLILSVIHHHQNPLASTSNDTFKNNTVPGYVSVKTTNTQVFLFTSDILDHWKLEAMMMTMIGFKPFLRQLNLFLCAQLKICGYVKPNTAVVKTGLRRKTMGTLNP